MIQELWNKYVLTAISRSELSLRHLENSYPLAESTVGWGSGQIATFSLELRARSNLSVRKTVYMREWEFIIFTLTNSWLWKYRTYVVLAAFWATNCPSPVVLCCARVIVLLKRVVASLFMAFWSSCEVISRRALNLLIKRFPPAIVLIKFKGQHIDLRTRKWMP